MEALLTQAPSHGDEPHTSYGRSVVSLRQYGDAATYFSIRSQEQARGHNLAGAEDASSLEGSIPPERAIA